MKEGKQKIEKSLFTSNILLFCLIIALIWTGLSCIKITYKKHQMTNESEKLEKEIEKIREDNQKMADIKALIDNPNFLEQEAKRRLNLKKEDEEVVMMQENQIIQGAEAVENEEIEGVVNEASVGELKKESNPEKWWKYFFH